MSSSYRSLVAGSAVGPLVVLSEPLSLWGGLDPATGLIMDVSHPEIGTSIAGKIVIMAHGRGSSSASAILSEAMRTGNAPAGLVLSEPDPILMIGALVGRHLYGVDCPIVVGPAPSSAEGVWAIEDGSLRPAD